MLTLESHEHMSIHIYHSALFVGLPSSSCCCISDRIVCIRRLPITVLIPRRRRLQQTLKRCGFITVMKEDLHDTTAIEKRLEHSTPCFCHREAVIDGTRGR